MKNQDYWLKKVSETIKERQNQKRGFLNILLCILASRLLVNMFAGKGVIRAGERANGAG